MLRAMGRPARQMYTMGTLCGTERRQKSVGFPASRPASFDCKLRGYGPTSGSDTLRCARPRCARASLYHQWTEELDLARGTFRSDALARATTRATSDETHRRLSVFYRHVLARRYDQRQSDPRDEPRHDRSLLRRLRVPADNRMARKAKASDIFFPDECRTNLIASECIAMQMVHRKGPPMRRTQSVRPAIDKSACSSDRRAYAQMRAAELMVRDRAERFQRARLGARQHGKLMAADASWAADRDVRADLWWIRLREDRHRTKIPRDAALSGGRISTNLILSYLAEHVLGLPRSY